MSYPNDIAQNTCGYDLPNFPYLYFASTTNPVISISFRTKDSVSPSVPGHPTPSSHATQLPPSAVRKIATPSTVWKYTTPLSPKVPLHQHSARIGLFCFPDDPTLQAQVIANAGLDQKYTFLGFYDAMWNSIWISILFGITSFLITQYFPLRAVPWTILIGGLCLFALGLMVLMYDFV